jgi:hypothetical protein
VRLRKLNRKAANNTRLVPVYDFLVEMDPCDSDVQKANSAWPLQPKLDKKSPFLKKVLNSHQEWDFSDLEPEERPMAVAWEYGRELRNTFEKVLSVKKKKAFGMFKSDLLHPVFLDFVKCPHWPSRPYKDLNPEEKHQAFPRAPWKTRLPTKPSGHLVQELKLEGHAGIPRDEIIQRALYPQGRRDPCRILITVNLGANSNLVLTDFKRFLAKQDLLLSAGRAPYGRDLTALGVLRLDRFFQGADYTDFYDELWHKPMGARKSKKNPKWPFVGKPNRQSYLRHAKARLGFKGMHLEGVPPFFNFFKNLGSFEG